MRRPLALLAIALALPAIAAADPLDLDLTRLGAPDPAVRLRLPASWGGTTDPATAERLAGDSRQRFALLASQLGLALDGFILAPASTTGYSGVEISVETGYAPTHITAVGEPGSTANEWAVQGATPSSLLLPAFHVRKGLPFGLEVGGRVIYLSQSSMVAGQVEAKWAFLEGIWYWPELAVRASATRLFGANALSLTTASGDFLVSKRFPLGGVLALQPYGAFRATLLQASSDRIVFGPVASGTDPSTAEANQGASFPTLAFHDHLFLRAAAGLRLTSGAFLLAAEGEYLPARTFTGSASAGGRDFTVPASFTAAGKVGVEF